MQLGINTLFHVPGDVGGTETYLRELLLEMVEEYPEVRFTVFTHTDNDRVMRDWLKGSDNARFTCLPVKAHIRPLRIVAEQLLLPRYVRKSGVDLLWSPGYTAPYFSSCPQVVTVHDLQYKRFPQDMKWLERVALDFLVRIACKRCESVITVSEFSRQEVVGHGFAPADKVQAVLEGVSPLFGVPVEGAVTGADALNELKLEHPFILCVAHTYPHKNVDLLVEAFARVLDSIPHNLVLVGKPRLGEPDVERAIGEIKKPERLIRLKSGVNFDLLRLLYQKADLFVLPSGYEGFGLPVLEAMMAGTQVVCAKEASLPEVGGSHATYIEKLTANDLAEQMLVALEMSDAEREQQTMEAREWARSFTWLNSARQTMSVFRECIQEGG